MYYQYLVLRNNGDQSCNWEAQINYLTGNDWLSIVDSSGVANLGGGQNPIDIHINTSGTVTGDTLAAEIIITTSPNVGTFTIPVQVVITNDCCFGIYNMQTEVITTPNTCYVELTWDYIADTCDRETFQYFLIKRNGLAIGTTTTYPIIDYIISLNSGIEYCYEVIPVYDEGWSHCGIGYSCVQWENPTLCTSPDSLYNEQWLNTEENVNLEIENCGDGTLAFIFPDYVSGNRFSCDNTVTLYDSHGNGWNGGGLDVYVNGVVVLNDITLASGFGPEYYSFPVEGGDTISTIYTAGSSSFENSYEIIDPDGNILYSAGNASIPAGTVFGVCPQPSFITAVNPATGVVPSGQTLDVTVTYNSAGFPEGNFTEWLYIETNDTVVSVDSIKNEMMVYAPGFYYGNVTSVSTNFPLSGVTVSASPNYSTLTNYNGYYELYVDEGIYDIEFSKTGYASVIIMDTIGATTLGTEINVSLNSEPFPVGWVMAETDTTGNECLVTWSQPTGLYDILYDDNDADDYMIWPTSGNYYGVRFTPSVYPVQVTGARCYVGDGSFPGGTSFLGTTTQIFVFDDDGVNNMPGTILDSIFVTVNNYNWLNFVGYFDNVIINSGDFYIAFKQIGDSTNSSPIGIDTTAPVDNRSVIKLPGNNWVISPYQDFMIRATVYGPTNINNNLNYTVVRMSDFDPNSGPEFGTMTFLNNTTNDTLIDSIYGGLPEGFYAYAVRANDDYGSSDWEYSNIVGNKNYNTVTIIVTSCDGEIPDSAIVNMYGFDYPYEHFSGYCNDSGLIVFEEVYDGVYDMIIEKPGYIGPSYNNPPVTVVISSDTTLYGELIQIMYPVTNISVDSVTSTITWENPHITQLYLEDFEENQFPPQDWQISTLGVGWYRSEQEYGSWNVPAGDGYYAVSNSSNNSGGDNTADYLITPLLDLRESDNFQLYFRSYFDGSNYQEAFVEYSLNNGNTWILLETISPYGEWHDIVVDLSPVSGLNSVLLAFHADDNGYSGSGWAIDNVVIKNGPANCIGSWLYLNSAFLAEADSSQTQIAITDLTYGQVYEFCVKPIYECGMGDQTCIQWTSGYIYPPDNFHYEYMSGTNAVEIRWTPTILVQSNDSIIAEGLSSFNLYRDSVIIANINYDNQSTHDTISYLNVVATPGNYQYWITSVYELDSYGFPGETAESLWVGPENVEVAFGSVIPFIEGWDSGNFTLNNWTFNQNSSNWSINTQEGESAPSVEFSWEPLLENGYQSELISKYFNVSSLTEGSLYLEFDLELIDRNTTGNEKFIVEVCNNDSCYAVAEFLNDGRKSFVNQKIDITDYSFGNSIQMKFVATGENSSDIYAWRIDNIEVYRICAPPEDLTGDVYWDNYLENIIAEVSWNTNLITNNTSSSCNKFFIYRMLEGKAEFTLYDSVLYNDSVIQYYYYDTILNPYILHCYKVTAHYLSNSDECESVPANSFENPTYDYLCLRLELLNNEVLAEAIIIYPNPAKDNISVKAQTKISEIELINSVGNTILYKTCKGLNEINFNVSGFAAGMYFIKVATVEDTYIRKIIIR